MRRQLQQAHADAVPAPEARAAGPFAQAEVQARQGLGAQAAEDVSQRVQWQQERTHLQVATQQSYASQQQQLYARQPDPQWGGGGDDTAPLPPSQAQLQALMPRRSESRPGPQQQSAQQSGGHDDLFRWAGGVRARPVCMVWQSAAEHRHQ